MTRNVLIAMGLAAALAMAGCHKNEEAPATDTPAMQDAAPAADAAAPAEQQAADAAAAAQSCTQDCGNGVTATIQCAARSEEHTSELQSLMRISYAVFCLKKTRSHTIKSTMTPVQNTQST